ncbi:MAG: HEPN domain-containing protein [Candidatus Bathyarchaeia archaeon]
MRRTRDWLDQAEGDLKAAKDLCDTGNYAWSCFASQQSAEKSLKAVLESLVIPSIGHNLLQLVTTISGKIEVSNSLKSACKRLNRFYIPTRYPNAFPSGAPIHMYDREDAVQAVKDAEEVFNFAKKVARVA